MKGCLQVCARRTSSATIAGNLAVNSASGLAAEDSAASGALLDLPLEQLVQIGVPTVVDASKYEQKTSEAPSSVSVITVEEIKHYGYVTLADILRSVRGLYVTSNRDYNFLGVRGFSRPGDYHRYDFIGETLYDNPPVTLNHDVSDTHWWGAELKYTTRLGKRNRLTLGAEHVDYPEVAQTNFDVDPFFEYLNYDQKLKTWAVYLQDEISLTDKLVLSLGLRYDDLYAGRTSTNSRLGLVYNPTQDTAIKLLYGTAFRAPNGYELYYDAPSVGYKTNPDLKPERIRTVELVLEQSLNKNLRGIASVYEYRIKDLITPVLDESDGLLVFQNFQKTKARGVDLELQARWAPLEGRVSYSYQDAQNEDTGERLSNAPAHLAKLNVMAPIWTDKLSLGFEAQYTASRKNDSSNGSADTVAGYTVANLTLLHRNWVKGLEISAGVKNLLDKHYADPTSSDDHPAIVAIPQDRRTYWLKLGYKF